MCVSNFVYYQRGARKISHAAELEPRSQMPGRVKLLIFIPYKIESFRFEPQKNERRQYQANHKHESSEHGYFAASGNEQTMLLVRLRFIESGR